MDDKKIKSAAGLNISGAGCQSEACVVAATAADGAAEAADASYDGPLPTDVHQTDSSRASELRRVSERFLLMPVFLHRSQPRAIF